MKNEILSHLNNPGQLELLYRHNKQPFRRAFLELYPKLQGNTLAEVWKERLSYEGRINTHGNQREVVFVILASLLAGILAKLPALLGLNEELFYTRNIGFIVFPFLCAYFAWKQRLTAGKMAVIVLCLLLGVVYINLLPAKQSSDTLALATIHLVLFLWCVLGFSFTGSAKNNVEKRLDFLKYNGDLLVIMALILIAGGILTGITIGLFSVTGVNIERFFFDYVIIIGLAAVPIAGTCLTQTNPQLVGKISPVIARIFGPLVLIMLLLYLPALLFSGKDPYQDREFLLIFNFLLIGVMAILFFSVAGTAQAIKSRIETWLLWLLAVVTIFVNAIALSAILFRISEWGFTPNRTAVLGGNVLILIHLLLVTTKLGRVLFKKENSEGVGAFIAGYLPVYALWAFVVTFLFPVLFGFK